VANHLAELAGAGVFDVDVGRVDVTGHRREQVDVFRTQGADQLGEVADLDLVEGAVLDELGGGMFHEGSLLCALQHGILDAANDCQKWKNV